MKNLKGIKKNITKENIEMVGNPNSLDIRIGTTWNKCLGRMSQIND
jgi:hypothetical protein